jgi:glycosyltransferase involved in cell wall biosynthesis
MRVCFVSHSAGQGGAEKALLELIVGLKERGVECRCVLPWEGPMVHELRDRGTEPVIVPYKWWVASNRSSRKRGRRTLRTIRALPALAGLIRSWNCELVYTNTITICAGALAARRAGRKHIWHIHEFGYEDHALRFDWGRTLSLRMVGPLSEACVVNSHALAGLYGRYVDRSKIHVVDYAVDVPPVRSRSDDREQLGGSRVIRCAIVGALTSGKRQEDAIEALHLVTRAGIPAELLVIGEGEADYTAYLHELVRRRGLFECVRFTGQVDNPQDWVARADVILMCSLNEAFGRVTVEAMKAGKPVIGSRSGGTREIIQEGETGLLYSPGNPAELAERILYLQANPAAARAMGERGRRVAGARFTRARYADAILDILTRALVGHAR